MVDPSIVENAHPHRTTLQALAIGRLLPEQAESIQRHLEGCESCRRVFASIAPGEQPTLKFNESAAGHTIELQNVSTNSVLQPRATTATKNTKTGKPAGSGKNESVSSTHKAQPVSSSAGERTFGNYVLLAEIARGGMGVVYQARQLGLNRLVALKTIKAGQFADDTEVRRFHTEAEAAAKLNHPGIVPIYEVGQHQGQHFFSMAFVEGESLEKRIAGTPLPPREAATLMLGISEAIAYAHSQGVIHRDLKPANVLLDESGTPKVADFGLAKNVHGESGLTQTGAIMGTPSYMPPEQALGNSAAIGPLSDVYSLGAILYCLLTGRPPFRAANPVDTLRQVIDQEPVTPRQLNPETPQDLETICLKCLSKEPEQRYATADDVVQELGRYLRGEPIQARPIGRLARGWRWCQRNPMVAGLTAAMMLVLLVGVGVSSYFAHLASIQAEDARTAATLAQQETERADDRARAEAAARREAEAERTRAKNEKLRADAAARDAMALADAERRAKEQAQEEKLRAEKEEFLAARRLYLAKLRAAESAWERDNASAAFHELRTCQPKLRGWEHDYLYTRFTQGYVTLQENLGNVRSVAFSPDGTRIASGSANRSLGVWDTATGKEVFTLKGHMGEVNSVAFSPDGSKIVSGSNDRTVRIWDAVTGEVFHILWGHNNFVSSVAFSPDGKWIVSGGGGLSGPPGEVKVWNSATGQETLSLIEDWVNIRAVAFNPDGKRILANANYGVFKMWDAATGRELRTFRNKDGIARLQSSLVFSPGGSQIVSGARDHTIRLWNAETGEEIRMLRGHTGYVHSVAFSPDGSRIVSGSEDATLKVWDAENGEIIRTLVGHIYAVNSVVFSPDGERILSGSGDGTLKIWDLATVPETLTLRGHTCPVNCVAISPDNSRIVSGGGWTNQPGQLKLWDAATGQEMLSLQGQKCFVNGVAFSPDGERIVSCGGPTGFEPTGSIVPSEIKVWDATTGAETCTLLGHANTVYCVTFSPDGTNIVSGSRDGAIKIWNWRTGENIRTLQGHMGAVCSLAFSPDGTKLVSGSSDKTLKFWDWATGALIRTLQGHASTIWSVAYSGDGKRVVSGSGYLMRPGEIKVWDAATAQEMLTLRGHRLSIKTVAFSPDGTRIVSGSEDHTLKIWDAVSGEETLTLQGHTDMVYCAAFSRNGRFIVSSSQDKTLKVWDAARLDDRQPSAME